MKKRLLSVLLSLVLVMSLAGGLLTTTAFADATITYTLKSGDTVAKVCKDLGIDFVKNYDWITKTNKITNYTTLPVGKVLTLPAPGTTPSLPSPTPSTATPAPIVSPGVIPPGSTDVVVSYLISHTMASGETVYKICNAYGVSFQQNSNTITKLNNITNYAKLKVGQVLLLPSLTPPASGAYYKVVAHRVVKGDTVVGICKSFGVDYGKNERIIKAINNKDNMASIKVNEIVYIPVLVNGAGGSLVPGSGSTVTTPTITYTLKKGDTVAKVCKDLGIDFAKNYNWITTPPASGTGTGTGGIGSTGAYSMHTGSNGTYLMQVGGKTVNTADKGQVVTIYPIPDKGYVLNGISVTKTGGTEAVAVTNNSFTMPDYEVSISVTFKPAS